MFKKRLTITIGKLIGFIRNFWNDSSSTIAVIVIVMILLMVTLMMIHPPVSAPSLVHYQLHLMKYNHQHGVTLVVLCIFRNDRVVGSNSEQLIVSQADEMYVCMQLKLKVLMCLHI